MSISRAKELNSILAHILQTEFKGFNTRIRYVRPCRISYFLTYLLTPWSRVLLEKLTGSAASQEIPHIYGTRRFITVFTSARHLSLSWTNSIQSPPPPTPNTPNHRRIL